MRGRIFQTVFRHAKGLAERDQLRTASDVDLYRSFFTKRCHAAFSSLVERHGPMVWGVCLNSLRREADAEDAFQATFLALAKAGTSLRNPACLGGWLHRVAVQICARLKRAEGRRRTREAAAATLEHARPEPDAEWQELHTSVHEEIDRLPDRLRTVLILCGLEGVRQSEAAARLGLKVNTVTALVTRARQRLLARLKEKGHLPVMLGAAGLAFSAPVSAVPRSLLTFVESFPHPTAAGTVSATVLHLARAATEVPMLRWKMLATMAMIGTALSVGAGGGFLANTLAQEPGPLQKSTNGTAFDPNANFKFIENQNYTAWATTGPNQPPARVPQWDYRVVALKSDPQAELLALGKEGWELVTLETRSGLNAYLKRPLQTAPVATNVGSALTERLSSNFSNFNPPTAGTTPEAELKWQMLKLYSATPNVDLVTFRLKRLNASTVATVLSEIFGKESGFAGAQPEPKTNSVLVTGTPDRIAAIRKLIEQLDSEPSKATPAK